MSYAVTGPPDRPSSAGAVQRTCSELLVGLITMRSVMAPGGVTSGGAGGSVVIEASFEMSETLGTSSRTLMAK
jgi:hypothetical protein